MYFFVIAGSVILKGTTREVGEFQMNRPKLTGVQSNKELSSI